MTLDTTTAEGRRALTEQHIKALQDAGCQMDAKSINAILHVQRAAAINADRAEREQVDEGNTATPCLTCSCPSREAVKMACETCGWDYSKGEKP